MLTLLRKITPLLLLLLPLSLTAQVVVEARMDTADILIGQQVRVRVKCSADAKARVTFPTFTAGQQLTPGVEVVSNGHTDTLLTNQNRRIELTRYYTVTSFDSALYALPPFKVQVDGREYPSRGKLGLKVSIVAVDTVHVDNFRGPHNVVEQPFVWSWRPTLLSLLAVLALVLTIALVVRLTDPRLITRRVVIRPPTPPHVTALKEIEQIKQKPDPDQKHYYMELSETLRTYIARRFGFSAREMTTSEIIDSLCRTGNSEALTELRQMLITADLVKFAKHRPTLSEQDQSLLQALSYVQHTKLEPAEQPKPRVEYVSLSNKRQIAWRNVMRVAALVLFILALALSAYVACDLYYCFG